MNTATRDFINSRPHVEVEPDAEYTCSNCQYHGKVRDSKPEKAKDFCARVSVICGGCGRWLVLVPRF